MYIKAHPFGYQPIKNKRSTNLLPSTHSGEEVSRIQTVRMLVPIYRVHRDENGKVLYKGRGKNRKPVMSFDRYLPQTRVIKHYDPKPKRGRTLAEMVYGSVLSRKK